MSDGWRLFTTSAGMGGSYPQGDRRVKSRWCAVSTREDMYGMAIHHKEFESEEECRAWCDDIHGGLAFDAKPMEVFVTDDEDHA